MGRGTARSSHSACMQQPRLRPLLLHERAAAHSQARDARSRSVTWRSWLKIMSVPMVEFMAMVMAHRKSRLRGVREGMVVGASTERAVGRRRGCRGRPGGALRQAPLRFPASCVSSPPPAHLISSCTPPGLDGDMPEYRMANTAAMMQVWHTSAICGWREW